MLIGRTRTGRALAAILDPDTGADGVYYPVTARPTDRKERKIYDEFAEDPTSNEEEDRH
jgi:hypothetical protein